MWKIVNSSLKPREKRPLQLNVDGEGVEDAAEVDNTFGKYFSTTIRNQLSANFSGETDCEPAVECTTFFMPWMKVKLSLQ